MAQVLPLNIRCWSAGQGVKGSYNTSYIQFEICEDNPENRNKEYFEKAFDVAAQFCVYIMKQYPAIKVENIVSHKEAHARGFASNHGDPENWLNPFGRNMNWFRQKVSEHLAGGTVTTAAPAAETASGANTESYIVKINTSALNIRSGPGINYKINKVLYAPGAYTIIEEKNGWGRLKSGAGWICLDFTQKVN